MAERSRQNGKTPVMAVLTDGKANIDLDGNPGRDKAIDDAQKITSIARDLKISAVFIDVGRQSNPKLLDLAHKMDAEYITYLERTRKTFLNRSEPPWKSVTVIIPNGGQIDRIPNL